MAEYTLREREADWLTLHIGENSYRIPLTTSITLGEANSVRTPEGVIAFFQKYVGEDVINSLTVDQFKEMTDAWKSASDKAKEGPGLGES